MEKRREEKAGICGICPAGCWVTAGVEDGKLVSIEADKGHPLGMICRRGQHAPEIVHSPDRLQYPMRRVGPKGTFEFERISWDEAYDGIVAEMGRIKEAFGPEGMSVYTGRGSFELSLCDVFQPKEAAVSSASSVLFPFGSPNTMGVGALCYVSFAMIAPHVTMGRMLVTVPSSTLSASGRDGERVTLSGRMHRTTSSPGRASARARIGVPETDTTTWWPSLNSNGASACR